MIALAIVMSMIGLMMLVNMLDSSFEPANLDSLDKLDDWQEFADRNNADDVIVLVSSFKVDDSGASPSLNPNSTYTNWKWVLVRDNGGRWRHVDHGY